MGRLEREELSMGTLLLREYDRLKDEQARRIGTRDNLIYATLASLGAIIAADVQVRSPAVLLLMPPVSLLLGWTYLANDEKISAIGRYLRQELIPRLVAIVGTEPVLGWETFHRADRRRRSRKIGQMLVDLMTFVLPSLLAVLVYWFADSHRASLLVASAAEFVATLALGWQIVRYAEVSRESPAAQGNGPEA